MLLCAKKERNIEGTSQRLQISRTTKKLAKLRSTSMEKVQKVAKLSSTAITNLQKVQILCLDHV